MPRYIWHIAGWDEDFEPDDAKRRGQRSPLLYVKEHVAGRGKQERRDVDLQTRLLLAEDGGPAAYAVYRRCATASGDRAEGRGYLWNHVGGPATIAEIAVLIGIRRDIVRKALPLLKRYRLMDRHVIGPTGAPAPAVGLRAGAGAPLAGAGTPLAAARGAGCHCNGNGNPPSAEPGTGTAEAANNPEAEGPGTAGQAGEPAGGPPAEPLPPARTGEPIRDLPDGSTEIGPPANDSDSAIPTPSDARGAADSYPGRPLGAAIGRDPEAVAARIYAALYVGSMAERTARHKGVTPEHFEAWELGTLRVGWARAIVALPNGRLGLAYEKATTEAEALGRKRIKPRRSHGAIWMRWLNSYMVHLIGAPAWTATRAKVEQSPGNGAL